MFKRIGIIGLAVFLLISCATANIVPAKSETVLAPLLVPESYPQMQTREMELSFRMQGCDLFGAYTDGECWILWGVCEQDTEDGKDCVSVTRCPGLPVIELSCQEAIDLYRETCMEVGNCS